MTPAPDVKAALAWAQEYVDDYKDKAWDATPAYNAARALLAYAEAGEPLTEDGRIMMQGECFIFHKDTIIPLLRLVLSPEYMALIEAPNPLASLVGKE